MAVAFDGFSIRAFTAKIRSVDVAKCWPFKEDNESDAAHLPPIAVAKFRWWAHELTRLRRSESAADKRPSSEADGSSAVALCPVCRDFSAATVNDVNAHIDECLSAADRSASESDRRAVAAMLARTTAEGEITVKSSSSLSSARAKLKPTKKRSIAEIFAVAPQIDSVDEGDSFDDGDRDLVDGLKALRLRKNGIVKKNKRDSDEDNCVGLLNNKKKLKKKNKIKSGSIIAIKKKAQKFKRRNHVKVVKKLKRFAKDILDSDSVCGKKSSGNLLSMQNVAEPSRSVLKDQEPTTLPTRGILKIRISCDPTAHNAPRDCEANNSCGILSSERHVRFSGKDDILGPKRKDFCSLEHNDGMLLSDPVFASSETVKSAEESIAIATEVTHRCDDDTSKSADIELSSSPTLPIAVQPNTGRVFPEKNDIRGSSYDGNLRIIDDNYPTAELEPGFTGGPRLFSASDAYRGNTQVGGSVTTTPNCNGVFVNHGHDCIYAVAEMKENTRRFPEPVSFIPARESENHVLRFQSRPDEEVINNNDRASCFQPCCRQHPMDLISGSSSFRPEWKQNAVVLRRDVDDNFFGLPLNSQGELIQSSSRGKCRYTDMIGSPNGLLPGHSFTQPRSNAHFVERDFPTDRGNLFLANNYARESRGFHLPARLGVTYWESNDRVDTHQHDYEMRINHSFSPVDAGNLMNTSFDGSRSYGQLHTQKMNENLRSNENSGKISLNAGQPTMRLMGKDVPIGRSSKETQGFEDGKVWTDKEMIIEHCQSSSGLDSSSLTRNFQEWIPQMASGKYKEIVPQPLDVHGGIPSQNHFLVKAPGASFSHRFLDWQTNDAFQTDGNASHGFLPFAHLPTSSTIFNGSPHFRDFFVSEAEPLPLRSQLSMLPNPLDSCEHVHWGPAELTNRRNLPHFSNPGFETPFSYQDFRANRVQSPWFQTPNGLPSWLLHAKEQGKTPIVSSQPQHISSRTNILNTPSVYHSADGACYSCNVGPPSHSHMNAPLGSATISLPSQVPVIPGVNLNSTAVETGYRNRMRVKERLKSKALGVKDLYPCKKINKSLVPISAELINPTRSILNLESHDSPIATMQNLNGETRCKVAINGLGGTVCYSTETQNDGMRISGNESSRSVDGMGKSGPIKLSAGTKHILTPNQNMDLVDNFIPVHSTIPFVVETSVGTVPHQSLKKATKIYRF